MRWGRVAAALLVVGSLGLGALWVRAPERGRPDPPPRPALAPTPPAPAAVVENPDAPGGRPAREPPASPESGHHPAQATDPSRPDPFGDLAYYDAYPLSEVPHAVVRGWGVGPRSRRPGHVGVTVVVDPAIDRAALVALVRDIRAYHRSADAVAVRIFDSMEAATYDRHDDGGALAEEHLVASIQRNGLLGIDLAEVRGEPVDAPTPGSELAAEPAPVREDAGAD